MIMVFFTGIILFSANEGISYSTIMSHDHFHNSPQLHPFDTAWDQSPQWGEKSKKWGKIEKKSH